MARWAALLLTVAGSVAICRAQQPPTRPAFTTIQPITQQPTTPLGCEYNGRFYPAGTTISETTGCMGSGELCDENGEILVWDNFGFGCCERDGQYYEDGETFTEGGVTCTCVGSENAEPAPLNCGVTTTPSVPRPDTPPPTPPAGCEYDGRIYPPGTTISETTGCRGSGTYCDENGQIYVSDNFGFGCCERDGQYYQDGETFTEGRVTCTCVGSRDAIPAPLNCTEGDCRGRWSTPEGCRGDDCDHSVSWTYNSDTDKIFFEMSARQTSDKWIGIGFSNDQLMANSDVIVAAVSPEGSVSITDRWASRRSMPTEDGSDDVENPQGSYNNGVINVNFTRQRNTGDDSDLAFTDDDCLYMFYALGGTYNHASQTLSKHATTPTISDQRICIRGDCPAREVCGENSNFHSCGHGDCQPTCEEPAPVCIQVCIPGCQCKAGFALRDGRCIPRSQCEGGGDYLDCNEPDVFWCDNGMCVHQNRTCNDEDNCGDRSDERGCPTGACKSSPCMNGASCCDLGDDEFSCLCRLGYHGETCGNFTDPCASESRCENGGTCMRWEMGGDTPPEYSCQCPPHFTGVTCEIPLPTVCDENTCENGGRCVTIPMPCMEGSGDCPEFRCVCPAGVTGYRCEFALGVCEEDSCFNDGECTQVPCKDYYSCECRNGTAGARCQSTGIIVPTECGENSYFHSCGYGDCQPTCEEPAPVCIQVCIPGCQCKAGFALRDGRCIPRSQCEGGGDYLDCNEPDVFWCDNGMCVHQNRTCNDEDNCGDRSDERGCPTGACKSSPCMNGASCCDLGDDEFSCLCRLGYHGETCGNFTDPCASESRCENGGTCMRWEMGGDTPPEYSCQCPPHFTGVTCEIPLPTVCDENTCENGGRCVTIPMPCMEGSGDCPEFRCVCPAGVTGYRCEFAIGMCEEESCFNDGECMQVPCKDYYSCECRNGTAGARCESTGIIDCSEPDVFWCDNGMCVHQNRTCNDEDNCGDRSDERGCPTGACKSSPCMNGASCCDLGDDKFSCLCRLGYHGDTCGNFTDPCASPDNPCANGGTCMSMDVGDGDGDSVRSEYSCQCPPGFTGMTCEIPLPTVCDENTCENGGRCVTATCSEGSGDCDPEFRCVCPPGVTGYRCEFVLGICEEDSCFNDGECMQVPCKDYYSCECRNGFNGPRCAMGESDAAFAVIRLVGGATEFEGRVEVRNRTGNGEWGTICDDDFDINAANVVCKQLGYGPALQLSGSHVFGEGSGPIWLDDVRCSGDEESLLDCPSGDWGEHNCDHYEDVGVICSYTADNVSLDIRLAEGTTPAQGRVEIRLGNGEWGTVCDDSFDMDDAHVVCRQLGYKFATSYEGSAYFGQGNGSIWLDDVECEGDEESLLDCSSSRWGQHNCGHSEDVGVVCAVQCEPINIGMCRNVVQYNTTAFPNLLGHVSQQSFLTTPESVSVITALMNSGCHPDVEFAVCSALVPNCIDSVQITPCKDFCNDVRASCEQVLLDLGWPWPFNCSRLNDRTQCITPYPVVVSTELTLPDEVFTEDLNNMTSPRYRMLAGTLESEASKAFSRYPSFRQATVKGFRPGSVRATLGLEFQSSGQPLSSDETVVGTLRQYVNETGGRLGNLSVSQVNVALPPAEIRLVGGSRRNEGRVEIRLGNGEWGTICDDSFDINDANVVCRQLGYGLAESYESSFYFGYGSGPIWLDEVECEGDEKNLLDCPSFGWGRHDCDHSEDVGVVCLVQCEPINIGMCRNVVPYNTTAFPNLLGHVSQQSFLTDQDSLNVITALMNSGCHPDVEFAVCSALVPNCIDSVQITPCRDFCNDIRASCEQVLVDMGQPWPFNCNSFNARTRCITPYPVVVFTELTLPDEVFTEELNNMNSSRYRMLAGTLKREVSKAFQGIPSFRQATVESFRSGSVIANLGIEFENTGQPGVSNETVVGTLRQYINETGGRLGNLSVSQVDVAVPKVEIRLVGGSNPWEGRVEIRLGNGEWGTICDDSFDINDAHVVCRKLGYGLATSYEGSAYFGQGNGSIWLDDVECEGDEENLLDCSSSGWGQHNCGHYEDVGVVCSVQCEPINIGMCRNVVPYNTTAFPNLLGHVSQQSFLTDQDSVSVITALMNSGCHPDVEFAVCSALVPNCIDSVQRPPCRDFCDGVRASCEQVLLDMGQHWPIDCNSFDTRTQCTTPYAAEIRLVGGTNPNKGRVEIRRGNGQWGTICDDSFDINDANVVCRQLGYGLAASYEGDAFFGPGNGSIWLDDVECEGDEENLLDCSSNGWGQHNCGHYEDVGVVCTVQCEPINIGMCRNVVPYNTTAFPNLLGHASQQSFLTDQDSVSVITALMDSGCHPDVEFAVCSALVPNCIDSVQITPCRDFCNDIRASCEQVLVDRGQPWPFNCNSFNTRTQCITPYPVIISTELTLPDEVFSEDLNDMDSSRYRMLAGTLEREASRAFQAIPSFQQATVDSLRSGSVIATLGLQFQNTGQALASDEAVVATFRQYISDNGGRLGNLRVSQVEVVDVVTPAVIRLVGGATEYEGRVEVRNGDGEWGTICDDYFDISTANVVCRQLGFGYALEYTESEVFGEGSGPIWLDDVRCAGDEESLLDCPSGDWGEHNCDHDEDVGVICSNTTGNVSLEIRLVGGTNQNEGRVEIRLGNGEWGTVCDDSFDINDAHVVCRQLGYGLAESYRDYAYFGPGNGSIWLDDVECEGDEESLLDCSSSGWGEHNCGHYEDVGVVCTGRSECDPIPFGRCQNLPYSGTSFPNWLGWQGPTDAIGNATAIFAALDQISDCHKDLDFFLCSLYFPSCTSTGIKFPCRSLCDEINNACALRALAIGIPWDTAGCVTLPDSSYQEGCIAPKATCDGAYECYGSPGSCVGAWEFCNGNGFCPYSDDEYYCSNYTCMPIELEYCQGEVPYNRSTLPNYFGQESTMMIEESDIHRNVSLLADTSCHEYVKYVYCHMAVPECVMDGVRGQPLCRSLCEEIRQTCAEEIKEIGVQFEKSSCDLIFPDSVQNDTCKLAKEFNCTFDVDTCEWMADNSSQAVRLQPASESDSGKYASLNGASSKLTSPAMYTDNKCLRMRYLVRGDGSRLTVYVTGPGGNSFSTWRESSTYVREEGEAWSSINLNINKGWPWFKVSLDAYVSDDGEVGVDDVTLSDGSCAGEEAVSPGCEPMKFERCLDMPYNFTTYPNALGWDRDLALSLGPHTFQAFDQIADCHRDLQFYLCSFIFPECTPLGMRLPCRSFCESVSEACAARANAAGLTWDPNGCQSLSDDEPYCSVPKEVPECDPIPFGRCQNMPYADTSFPNWLGWQGPTDAIGNATAIFAALDQISDCHKDLDFFLCSLYFPSCTSTGIKFPCRSLCDEINNACALRALAIGIPWDTAGCVTLPESSYLEGCIAPKATCDGAYECYGSPGSCVGAWEFCDGNGFCPYNDDEFACSNYTCMPIELEYCQDEVPYDRTILPNYFGQENTMMIEESDIHRNVSLLADTSCHEYVKYVYCHMAVPECIMDGVRGQPLCRSLCEEIRQTCAEEIKEIGFQFEKSTCDMIFPDSVQNDTCQLAKEFNCTFDDDTCEWMAGNSSQAVMLQPTSESNSGKYASLNGALSKLTSPTMYTDNKCLRMRYLVRGDGSRLTVYVTGPDGNSFSTWRQSSTYVREGREEEEDDDDEDEEEEEEWSSINLNINKGWPWFKVSLDAYVAVGGEVGVDDVTLSDGSCEAEEVSLGCEPMKFERCLDMPYNFTTYPNALGWDRDLALSLGPHTFQAFDQIADCHRDLQFYLCSFIFPECTPFGMRLPCRSFCERVSEACATRANAAGLTWDPNGCQSLPDDEPYCSVPKGEGCPEGHHECYGSGKCVGPWQFCDGMPDCPFNDDEREVVCGRYECMPMDFEYCQDVVNYTRAFFPNYYGQQNVSVIEQSDIHQIAVSFASTNCHPDSNLFYCHLVVPECQENDVRGKPVCRAVCEEVRQECSDEVDALQVPLTKEWCYATFPDSVHNDTCILFRGLNCTFDDDFCNWDQVVRGSQPWTQVMSSSRQGKHITSSGPSSHLLVSPRIYTDDKCLRFYYMLTGSDTRVLLKLIGPNGVSWNAWNTTTSRSVSNQWTTASIGIKTGLESVQVSIQAFADGDGSFSIDNVTLSDGPCSKEVECEPIMIDVCRGVVPYTETLFPNLLGHSSQQAFLDDPNSVNVINQLMNSNCHPDIGFAVCSALVPRCVDSSQLPPCRGFCNEIRASCQPVLGMAGQEWPFECEAFPFEFQGECSTPAPAQCERIEIGMCRNVVPYNTTTFPNLLGHVSQQSFLTTPESVSVITALMNSGCHPDVEFAVCSALVPNCIDSMQIPPCRDFCNEVKDSCEQLLMDIGESWPFECNDFAPRGRCISPDPVVVYAALTLPDEDFTDDLYDSSTPRYRVLTSTLEREIPKAFETPVTVTVASLRPGSVIATVGMGFENTGQAPESDEAAIATLQQYVSGKRGRLGSLTVSQVVGVPPVDVTRPCDENPCGDNGICEEVDGTFGMAAYRCTCQDGFTGYNCEIRIAGRCHESIQSVLSEQDGSPIVGVFLPQCRDDGSYENLQCHPSTGYCWCVTADGSEVPGTQTPPGQNRTDCVAAMSVELYPFGPGQGDTVVEFSDLDDGTSDRINIPAGFPFFYTRHSRFYIGVNGLISFGRRYGSYIPVPFRTGSGNTRPVIAPFWADHDLRRRDGQSNVFYQEYRGKVVRLPANSGVRGVNADVAALAQNVVTRVISDVTAYADLSDDFDPSWIAVITWSNMTAYPSGSNPDQTVTHQLVLATDGVKSFALFNYGAMNWEQTWREARLGYTAADSINFFDSKYSGLPEIFNINEFVGNTGIRGKWFFRLDDPAQGDVNYDQLCLGWADLQDEALLVNFTSDSQPCPCSWTQAVRDRRFRINWDDMCAELRWTSPLGIGQRCCYSDVEDDPEDSGALLLGFPGGGSVILYDPRVDAEQYQSQDLLPRTHCCLLSRNCELFYRYRPSDTCERYDPPRWAIALGDPHLTTLDGKSYTFNGLGEYLVLDVPDAMLVVQGRTRKAVDVNGTETRATIFSAFVAKQGNSSTVQINLKDDTSGVDVYVDRQMFSGFADLAAGDAGQDFEDVTVSKGTNGSAIATFSSGIAIEVAVDVGIMAITVMAPPKFKGNTKGLLGLWNDDVTDDFTRPDGTSISINASDSDIYHSFGQLWNVSEADSIFYYGSQSWSDFANSDPDFVPLLEVQFATEELRQQAVALCGDNKECLFDTAATSDLLTGASTANTESRFEEDTSLIANFPPTIFGPTVVNATVGKEVSFDLTATDINNDTVRFSAQGLPDNAAFNNASAMFIWTPSRINSLNMSFTASDGKGGTSILRPTVNLCKCENDGTCDFDNMADDQNVDSLLRVVACQCGPGLEGTFCEVDIDGCEDDPCYMGVNCTDVPAPGVGYTCSACPDGTEGDGTKCRDIDECTNGTHQCGPKAQCRNEMMSYRCECPAGYRLDDNKRNCSDIDECADGVSGCTQLCNNTDGGFLCDCYQGFFLNATNNVTCYQDQAARNVCAVSVCENCRAENDVAVCFCPSGYKLAMDNITCEDVDECAPGNEELNRCSQKKNCQNTDGGHTCSCDIGYLLEDDLRTCTICPDGKYGVGCAEICGCNRGECNVTVGCVCPAGWKGDQCEADVNECDDGDMCRSNETCVNRIGSYECVCSTGFAADESGTCQDVDECVAGHNCHALANCTNIVGSFTCTCAPGYVGDGVTCEPATTPAPSTTPTPSTSSQSTSAPASTPAAPASTPTASRPTATASRPTATASRPTATTSRPTATASRPTATTSRPTATASRPTATASRPTATASRPTATASRPTATTSRPTATTSRPTATASRPTATASRPTATASRPTGSQQTQQTTPTQAQPAGSSTAQQTITTPLRGSTTAKTSKTPTVSQSISTAQSTPAQSVASSRAQQTVTAPVRSSTAAQTSRTPTVSQSMSTPQSTPAQASTARQTVTTPVRDSTTAQTSKQPTVSQSISTPQSTPGSQTAAESSTQTSQPTTAPAQTTPDPASTVVVPTEVTLVWDFTEDLNNRTHPVFIDLENKVKREVSKAYENNPNFQSVIVKGFSAGSVIASFDTVFKKGQTVPDPVEAVALLKQYIDNNGGKLGDLSTTQVSYAPPGTTPVPITDCECAVEVNCVSYGGKCLAFCSPNPDYCLNGGTCMDSNTETLTCQCTSSFTTTYSGDRCESRGTGNVVYAAVGAVAAFLLLLILIIAATKNCWKSKSQPLSDNSLYANRRAMNYAPAGLERGLRSTSAAKYRPSVYESGQGATVVYDFSGKGKAAGYQYNNVVYDNVRAAPQMQSRPDEGAHVYHNPIHQEEHPYQSLVRPHDRGYQQPTTTTFTGQQKITNLQRNVHVNQFQIPRAKSPYRPATSYSTNFQTADDSRL
ncbi:uncharacterized protein LOC144910683 isoform X23 [Branchiostoma floridae x Branchiostoma belcheri]